MGLGNNRDYKTSARKINRRMAQHKAIMDTLIAGGMSKEDASKAALEQMKTPKSTDAHEFCRQELKAARKHARVCLVNLPKNITALRTATVTRSQWFIEADGAKGQFHYGCCAFEAKAKYILDICG